MRGIVALLWNPAPLVLELRRTPAWRSSQNFSYTSFSEIASSRKWSGGCIDHPCQRTQNDGGGVEVLHPLSVWIKQG